MISQSEKTDLLSPFLVDGELPKDISDIAADFLRVQPWISEAVEQGGNLYTLQDVFRGVLSKGLQLWPGEKACILSQIGVSPRKKVLNAYLAGDADELERMIPDLETYARDHGCTAVSLFRREGLVADPEGYRPLWQTSIKELSSEA